MAIKTKVNSGMFKKGHTINNGKRRSIATEFKKGQRPSIKTEFKKGSMIRWKGENASYQAKHMWVYKHLGRPHFCEECGNKTLRHRQYHWANISGKYKRNLEDWKRLCAKCHKLFDKTKRHGI